MLQPLHNKTLIRRENPEEITSGGIILAHSARKPSCRGTVLAVGPGQHVEGTFQPTTLQAGDRVIYPDGLGAEVEVDGETLLMISEDLVIAKIVPDGAP